MSYNKFNEHVVTSDVPIHALRLNKSLDEMPVNY